MARVGQVTSLRNAAKRNNKICPLTATEQALVKPEHVTAMRRLIDSGWTIGHREIRTTQH